MFKDNSRIFHQETNPKKILTKIEAIINGSINENSFVAKFNELQQLVNSYCAAANNNASVLAEKLKSLFDSSRLGHMVLSWKQRVGNFEVLDHIYRNTPQGTGTRGQLFDQWLLSSPAAETIRNRRRLVGSFIKWLSESNPHDDIKIASLACGACREVSDVLADTETLHDNIQFTGYDLDNLAVEESNRALSEFEKTCRAKKQNVLNMAAAWKEGDQFRAIYSMGLMDYFSDKLFTKLAQTCHAHLEKGGVLILGNVGPVNLNKNLMRLAGWKLIERTPEQLCELVQPAFGDYSFAIAEKNNVNFFVVCCKDAETLEIYKEYFNRSDSHGHIICPSG